MTSTLPYDRHGAYSILHNHLRAYEQARLQRLAANGHGNEAARARMRIANLNLQADAARRAGVGVGGGLGLRGDSEVTLVGGGGVKEKEEGEGKGEAVEVCVEEGELDSETEQADEYEDGALPARARGNTEQAVLVEVRASMKETVVVTKEMGVVQQPGEKDKKGKEKGRRRKIVKDKVSRLSFSSFTGYVPKRRGPEFAVYPI